MGEPPPKIDIGKMLRKGIKVHSTLEQEILVTTCDKLRLCLIRNQKTLLGRIGPIAPLGIFLAFLTTLIAVDFSNPARFLSGHTWQAAFLIAAFLSLVWLVYSLYNSFPAIMAGLRGGTDQTIEGIVAEMKTNTVEVSAVFTAAQETPVQPARAAPSPPAPPQPAKPA